MYLTNNGEITPVGRVRSVTITRTTIVLLCGRMKGQNLLTKGQDLTGLLVEAVPLLFIETFSCAGSPNTQRLKYRAWLILFGRWRSIQSSKPTLSVRGVPTNAPRSKQLILVTISNWDRARNKANLGGGSNYLRDSLSDTPGPSSGSLLRPRRQAE